MLSGRAFHLAVLSSTLMSAALLPFPAAEEFSPVKNAAERRRDSGAKKTAAVELRGAEGKRASGAAKMTRIKTICKNATT